MELFQCMECGADAFTKYELKNGLCPTCQDEIEEFGYTECPKCGRHYDKIDAEYQSCSKCGWDAENNKWGEKREPDESDFLNGEADILTGRWY